MEKANNQPIIDPHNIADQRKEQRKLYKKEFKGRLKKLINVRAKGKNSVFADMIDEPIENITNWTKGNNSLPSVDKVNQICEKTEISVEWLICGTRDMEPDIASRWDHRWQVWTSAWYLNQAYLNEKLPFIYRFILKKKINSVLRNRKLNVTEEKAKAEINKVFKEWCEKSEYWISWVRELEDIKSGIHLTDLISQEQIENRDLLSARIIKVKAELDDHIKAIDNYLKLF